MDLTGSPSKDAAIKVLEVFHTTVRGNGKTHVGTNPEAAEGAKELCVAHVLALHLHFSSTAAVKEMTRLSSNKSSAPCVPKRLKIFGNLRYRQALTKAHNKLFLSL